MGTASKRARHAISWCQCTWCVACVAAQVCRGVDDEGRACAVRAALCTEIQNRARDLILSSCFNSISPAMQIIEEVGITDQHNIEGVVDKIFDKALTGTRCSKLCANICKVCSVCDWMQMCTVNVLRNRQVHGANCMMLLLLLHQAIGCSACCCACLQVYLLLPQTYAFSLKVLPCCNFHLGPSGKVTKAILHACYKSNNTCMLLHAFIAFSA